MKKYFTHKLVWLNNKVFKKITDSMQEQNSTIHHYFSNALQSNLYGVKNRLIKEDKIKNPLKNALQP